jgi:replicative DNA helicase
VTPAREKVSIGEVVDGSVLVDGVPDRGTARSRRVDGATFVFSEPADVPTIWGTKETVVWAAGEGFFLVGPDGVGKTTVAQQLVRARLGLRDELFGLAIPPDKGRVLYIAADRPRQAQRSLRRMVSEKDTDVLRERLVVWKGPLPFDLTESPRSLADFAHAADAGPVFIDSLKDVALDLSKDETGSRVNLAFQELIASGIELCVLHHQRKEQQGVGKPKRLADVYGSRWLTAGMGSVVLLWGEPGDLVVDLVHLKQPAGEFGPIKILHDHDRGISTADAGLDLERLLANAQHGLVVEETARLLFHKDRPTRNEIEKARRRLDRLVANGAAQRNDDPDGLARYFVRNAA